MVRRIFGASRFRLVGEHPGGDGPTSREYDRGTQCEGPREVRCSPRASNAQGWMSGGDDPPQRVTFAA